MSFQEMKHIYLKQNESQRSKMRLFFDGDKLQDHETPKIVQMENGEIFHIQEEMTCKTKNVVYLLVCNNCQRTYIGETGKGLRYRAGEHRTHINNSTYRKLEVSHHVHECAGHLAIPFRIVPFYKMPLNCTRLEREAKEFFFQRKFCPSLHPGPRRRLTIINLTKNNSTQFMHWPVFTFLYSLYKKVA